jgi:hypothetical protein
MKVVTFGAIAMAMAMAWGLAACGIEGPSQEAMTSSELGAGAYLTSPKKGRVIGRAADLDGPNGVFVGQDGNLYVANLFGDEITVHNPHSGAILDRIGPERGVHGPDDVVVADDGTIYWTEFLAGNVGMLKPNGEYRTQFVGPGVNPITISDDGRLFVARDFAGQGLYELDPQLLAPPEVLIADLANFNGMDFGPDGLLYGPLVFDGTIVRIDVDASNPSPVVVASGFTRPAAVCSRRRRRPSCQGGSEYWNYSNSGRRCRVFGQSGL